MSRTLTYISNWDTTADDARQIDSRQLEYRGISIHQVMWLQSGKTFYTQEVCLPDGWWTDDDLNCHHGNSNRAARLAMDVIDSYMISVS